MPSIIIKNLTFSYNFATPILEDANAHINASVFSARRIDGGKTVASAAVGGGWVGLTGENGAGKSTLLRLILAAENGMPSNVLNPQPLIPDSGSISIEPPNAKIHYCEQELHDVSEAIWDFALDYEGGAGKLRSLLKLDVDELERWQSLSAGERKRWQIGAALNAECDILLLDEPANHLDSESQELLLLSLREFKGLGIVISHNRYLLDNLTNSTIIISHGKIHFWNLPYTQAKAARDAELKELQNEKDAAQRQLKSIKRQLQEAREKKEQGASRAKKQTSGGDPDSRSIMASTVRMWAGNRASKNVQVLRSEKDKMERSMPLVENMRELGRSVFMEYEQPRKPYIFNFRAKAITPRRIIMDESQFENSMLPPGINFAPQDNVDIQNADEKILLRNVNFTLERGEHIHLQGKNGAGKSTLIRSLLATSNVPKEKLLVLPQEHSKSDIQKLITECKNLDSKVLGRVMSIFAALGSPASILNNGDSISPGEARKLHLALGMGNFVWALILDEPTNHLDLPSTERLENALAAFPGALLLVCHDLAFAEKCTSKTVRL